MADIKWIKVAVDMFEDEKILLLETLDNADELIVIWIKLLCLAGRQNNGGVFLINGSIPYTAKTLARVFRRDVQAVREALDTFEEFGLIETVEDVITIPNWEKHQNIDGMERIREQNRIRNAKYRERQNEMTERDVTVTSRDTSRMTSRDGTERRIKNKDKEYKEKEYKEKEKPPYGEIVQMYKELCPDLVEVKVLTDTRKGYINERWKEHGMEGIRKMLTKAGESDFLKGENDSGWVADFSWIMRPENFAKVLEGKYDKRNPKKEEKPEKEKGSFDTADFFKAAVNRRAT